MRSTAIGIDIGGTNTKFAVVDLDGKVVDPQSFRTQPDDPFATYAKRLKEQLTAYLTEHKLGMKDVLIGVGLPNYSSKKELLINPVNLSWGTFPIQEAFSELFDCPVYMENDANVAALGERLWGRGKKVDDFIVVTVGTGIGTGVYSQGKLLLGHTGQAGEGGHLIVGDEGRPCNCGGKDHFESYCSVLAMKNQVQEKIGKEMRYHDIVSKFMEGDAEIIQIYKDTARYFARGLHQLAVCFSPKKIILAGGGMAAGEDYLKMIQTEFDTIVFSPLRGQISIEVSDLSTVSGAVLGAAALAFERHHQHI